MRNNNKETVASNLFWRLLERFGAQGVTFIVSIVLARLLDPDVYGKIALVTIFISIMQVFVDSGLGNALIQKKDADDLDFSTVFYFNIFFCAGLYVLMLFVAPLIALFYDMPDLISVIRVLSLVIVISGIKNVQQSYVSRNMMFKKFFFSTLGGTIGAAFVGIYMAYKGYGVWALVIQNLVNVSVDTVILWVTVKWRPKKCFSFYRLKSLYSYGWKLLVAKLIDTIYEDVRSLIIGRKYSSVELALYNRGKQFPQFAVSNISSSIENVLFSAMSMEQDDLGRVKAMTSRAIKTTSYIILPIMVGLAVCAEPLVRVVLTEKWIDCVPYLRIFCAASAIVPVTLANLNAIKAIGRSDIYLKLEIARKAINTISLLIFMWFGVKAIAYSYLLNCIMNLGINAGPNKRILNYGYFDQIKDIIPSLVLSSIMGAAAYAIKFFDFSDVVTLLIQVPLGCAIYLGLSKQFSVDSLQYICKIIGGLVNNKNK